MNKPLNHPNINTYELDLGNHGLFKFPQITDKKNYLLGLTLDSNFITFLPHYIGDFEHLRIINLRKNVTKKKIA
jgi:Leucine-rich repeat (LRR) protein